MVAGNEGFLRLRKANASGMLPDSIGCPRLFSGPTPSKLQPLQAARSNRTHQMLADAEKILGRTLACNRVEAGYQPREVLGAERGDATAFAFADFGPEDVDNIKIPKRISQTPTEAFQIVESPKTVLESEASEDQNLSLKRGNLSKDHRCSWVGEVADGLTGGRTKEPGSWMVRDGGFFQALGKEVLSPTASSPKSASQKSSLEAPGGQDDICSTDSRQMLKSRRERTSPEQGQGQILELSKSSLSGGQSGRVSAPQPEVEMSSVRAQGHNSPREVSQGTVLLTDPEGKNRIGENACALRMAADFPIQTKVEKASGVGPSGGSSVMSSLADHLDSQILGEVDNFSWDLQSSRESDHHTDEPLLESLHAQTLNSLGKSGSEYSSEEQKLCESGLHLRRRPRGGEQAVPGPLKQQQECTREPALEQSSSCVNLALPIAQEETEEAGGRPRQTTAVFQRGGLQCPGEHQVCLFQNRHAEAGSVQNKPWTEDDSKSEHSPVNSKEVSSIFVLSFSEEVRAAHRQILTLYIHSNLAACVRLRDSDSRRL